MSITRHASLFEDTFYAVLLCHSAFLCKIDGVNTKLEPVLTPRKDMSGYVWFYFIFGFNAKYGNG